MTADRICGLFALLTAIVASSSRAAAPPPATQPSSRSFRFTYSATITGLTPKQRARVWISIAPTNDQQQADILFKDVPAGAQTTREQKYGNGIIYFETAADGSGAIPFSIVYRIRRHECQEAQLADAAGLSDEVWLQRDALVPVGGKSRSLMQGKALPGDSMQLARLLYDVVDDHMQYRKDKPGYGRGDADWACDSGFGNCTDFHSLFISLARYHRIPARFEIGFPIASSAVKGASPVAGYHCWAWCKPNNHAWVPVDISEANKHPNWRDYFFGHLDADRVAFSVGRDLTLTPPQEGPPLNFFIYPYVEVDGKPYPYEKITRKFESEDMIPSPPFPKPPTDNQHRACRFSGKRLP